MDIVIKIIVGVVLMLCMLFFVAIGQSGVFLLVLVVSVILWDLVANSDEAREERRRKRDRETVELVRRAIAIPDGRSLEPGTRPVLYLRSFSGEVDFTAIDRTIDEALRGRYTFVAFADSKESTDNVLFGAARFLSKRSKWFSKFERLAQTASWIVILPAPTPGLLMEIEWLKSRQLLWKVVFIMAPSAGIGRGTAARESWLRTQRKWATRGLRIPEYRKGGLYFGMDQAGDVIWSMRWRLHAAYIGKLFTRLEKRFPASQQYNLPEDVWCPKCRQHLKLTLEEQQARQFVCRSCGDEIVISD